MSKESFKDLVMRDENIQIFRETALIYFQLINSAKHSLLAQNDLAQAENDLFNYFANILDSIPEQCHDLRNAMVDEIMSMMEEETFPYSQDKLGFVLRILKTAPTREQINAENLTASAQKSRTPFDIVSAIKYRTDKTSGDN